MRARVDTAHEAGRRLDLESGLVQYRHRYYHMGIGRFVSRDPAGYGDGYGVYSYVANTPTASLDPMGEEVTDESHYYPDPIVYNIVPAPGVFITAIVQVGVLYQLDATRPLDEHRLEGTSGAETTVIQHTTPIKPCEMFKFDMVVYDAGDMANMVVAGKRCAQRRGHGCPVTGEAEMRRCLTRYTTPRECFCIKNLIIQDHNMGAPWVQHPVNKGAGLKHPYWGDTGVRQQVGRERLETLEGATCDSLCEGATVTLGACWVGVDSEYMLRLARSCAKISSLRGCAEYTAFVPCPKCLGDWQYWSPHDEMRPAPPHSY